MLPTARHLMSNNVATVLSRRYTCTVFMVGCNGQYHVAWSHIISNRWSLYSIH